MTEQQELYVWVGRQMGDLRKFKEWWLRQEDKEQFPFKLPAGEWEDQFDVWREMKEK